MNNRTEKPPVVQNNNTKDSDKNPNKGSESTETEPTSSQEREINKINM